MKEAQASVFMVDLDSLFDTRHGTLVMNFFDETVKLFEAHKYHGYLDFSFNGFIDKEAFSQAYDARDKRALANSTLTLAIDIVRDFVLSISTADPNAPYVYYPKIVINTYPYQLTDEEKENIGIGISAYLKDKVEIEIVYMSYEELTVDFVADNLTVLMLFEYHKWLDAQANAGNFNKRACADVTLFGPEIFFKETPRSDKERKDTFLMLTNISRPFVNLELLSSSTFSTFIENSE